MLRRSIQVAADPHKKHQCPMSWGAAATVVLASLAPAPLSVHRMWTCSPRPNPALSAPRPPPQMHATHSPTSSLSRDSTPRMQAASQPAGAAAPPATGAAPAPGCQAPAVVPWTSSLPPTSPLSASPSSSAHTSDPGAQRCPMPIHDSGCRGSLACLHGLAWACLGCASPASSCASAMQRRARARHATARACMGSCGAAGKHAKVKESGRGG